MAEKRVLDESTEKEIRKLARQIGYEDTPLASSGSHQIELHKNIDGKKEYVYISRFTGITKGQLQIVISPELDKNTSASLSKAVGVFSEKSGCDRGKEVQSSQYKGFKNKGAVGEHRGRAWRVGNSNGLEEFKSLLSAISQNSAASVSYTSTAVSKAPVSPERKGVYVNRVIRDTAVSKKVKEMYGHACQICGLKIETSKGFYAEGAHVKPLGSPHNGPDVLENILCLCPNHHVMLDYGIITINDDLTLVGVSGTLKMVGGHNISSEYLAYQRENS
uniref:HNH endonuclease n=1 Tax=Marinobacterium profundum TaxID=1714300 RepID=UPI0009E8DFF9|nr:HNH endonuclease [Marinobacterium profundum]